MDAAVSHTLPRSPSATSTYPGTFFLHWSKPAATCRDLPQETVACTDLSTAAPGQAASASQAASLLPAAGHSLHRQACRTAPDEEASRPARAGGRCRTGLTKACGLFMAICYL